LAAIKSGDPDALLPALTNTYLEILAGRMDERAVGIADEIQANLPDLIGLQEISVLSTGAYQAAPTNVVASNLNALLIALQIRGLNYAIVAVQKNAQVVVPALDPKQGLIDVGFTDYDVVLARADLPVSDFKLENTQQDHFTTIVNFPVAGQSIPFLRGWIAVDAKIRGKNYRFVTTHLETFSNEAQWAQTEELLSGPLSTDLPVVLAADLNSDADAPSFDNGPAYGVLIAAGFQDAWTTLHPGDLGYTWPLFVEDSGIGPHNSQRIDLILTRGDGIRPESILLTGTKPFTDSLLASDHAGVVGSLVLLP
jgi:endonuclease/exonuclease/phosphatase family metal-dependent hydrolase